MSFAHLKMTLQEGFTLGAYLLPDVRTPGELWQLVYGVAKQDPVLMSLFVLVLFTLASWLLSLATDNYSWVDRYFAGWRIPRGLCNLLSLL